MNGWNTTKSAKTAADEMPSDKIGDTTASDCVWGEDTSLCYNSAETPEAGDEAVIHEILANETVTEETIMGKKQKNEQEMSK